MEKVVKKAQALVLAKKQSIIMKPEEMQVGMAKLKVAQNSYDFPISAIFAVGVQPILQITGL